MVKNSDYFLENFSMLVASGMDVSSALTILLDSVRSLSFKKILIHLKNDLDNGLPLSQALKKTHFFSPYALSLIQLGEETGRLPQHLTMIVSEQKKSRALQSKINSAMIYPVLILSLSLIITVGIAWFILPHLSKVFFQMHIDLPFFTRALLEAGKFLQRYGIVVIPFLCIASGIGIYLLFFFSKTNFIGQALIFYTPAIRRVALEIELARFGSLLGSLLSAGLPIVEAFRSLSDASSFAMYKKFYARIATLIEDGSSIHEAIQSFRHHARLIPIPLQGMIAASEQSGKLSETLCAIGTLYEEKSAISSKNLSTLLEPILLLIVWFGVVGVALAVILPIYNLIGGFKTQ